MNLAQEARQTTNFKFFLQQELVERCRKNPRYSLRAFAKALGVGAAALSDMLNGKRSITGKSIEKIGLALGLSLKEIDRFKSVESLNEEWPRSPAIRFQQITLDTFALISDWYHYAILELLKVDGFQPSAAWIAKALGITKTEVNVALERLERLHLLERHADGHWEDVSEGFSTSIEEGLTSAAARKLQKQILAQSVDALEKVPIELRNHTAMTMAIDPADLPFAVAKIAQFRRGLCALLEKNKKPKDVYHLSISLFPSTQLNHLKGEIK